MASNASIHIRVRSARGHSIIQYTSKGRYVSLTTAGYNRLLPPASLQPTSSNKAFWTSVVALVAADITATG